MTAKAKKILTSSVVAILFVLLIAIELGKNKIVAWSAHGDTLYNIATRFIG